MFLRISKSSKSVHKSFQNVHNWKLYISLSLSQKYFFNLVRHLPASEDPDGWGYGHGHQPGQARTNGVEHLKECSEEAEEEHHHVKEAECHEARVQGDKLYMMIKSV